MAVSKKVVWRERLRWLRGEARLIETNLRGYQALVAEIAVRGESLHGRNDAALQAAARHLRVRVSEGAALDDVLTEAFALVRETAVRVLGERPYDEQLIAGLALQQGKLAELQTGEGKTLSAVAPAFLSALTGRGVHVLTFNDYLARRDAEWMGPIYRFLGLSVASIQAGMSQAERKAAYAADVTYATAKEVGFDFLRMQLCRSKEELVLRSFHCAIIDEADSILIDEARVPLVIAGERLASSASPYRVAEVVRALEPGLHFDLDENGRNVFLTDAGIAHAEAAFAVDNLYTEQQLLLLTEVHQALHARALLHRDVDYIVRAAGIEVVDELTGRVMDDRRWPDGLQAALEAKEGLPIRPGGRILGSITLQHFLARYPRLAGMTATASSAAEELSSFYRLTVVPIPPHRPCVREDLPDIIFASHAAKQRALIAEILQVHASGRPLLVGTSSVEESESLAAALWDAGAAVNVLNAKQDEQEAAIIAGAGAFGALTISTNMAGRGTDIRLGGRDERERERVVALGGLYVIGTNRHESRRIDDQLRGRAGRQGDPGQSRLFVSLEDPLMARFGVCALIPEGLRPAAQLESLEHPLVRRQVSKLQHIVECQNHDIRQTLWRFSMIVEQQRERIHGRRMVVLCGEEALTLCQEGAPRRYVELEALLGQDALIEVERQLSLYHLDRAMEEHLEHVAHLREWIHLVRLGGGQPLDEFAKQLVPAFDALEAALDDRILAGFEMLEVQDGRLDLAQAGLTAPSATWTYLVNDQMKLGLEGLLAGSHNFAFAAGAALTLGPLLAVWAAARWIKRRRGRA